MYVSVCDATGVFSILGMFWKEDEKDRASSSSRLCSLMIQLGKVGGFGFAGRGDARVCASPFVGPNPNAV